MIRQKKNSGFTLAELLIVVAVVGILVAISIPVFTSQLHKGECQVFCVSYKKKFIGEGNLPVFIPEFFRKLIH